MAKLQAEIAAKKNDEDAQKEAQEREAKLRIEMELKLEEERKRASEEEAKRLEKIKQEEENIKRRQAETAALEAKLEQILPQVREANLIAGEFDRKITFSSQLSSAMPDFDDMKAQKREFKIKVDNREEGYFYVWDADRFANRVYMMRDKYNEYVDNLGKVPDFSNKEEDPFWDSPEPVLIGKSYLALASLAYTLDEHTDLKVFSTNTAFSSGECGQVAVGYDPVGADGGDPPEDLQEIEDVKDLLGRDIYFNVNVTEAKNLPMELCTNAYVEYIFKHEPENVYRTDVFNGKNPNPVFNYTKSHAIDCVNEYILDYLNNGNIVFKTYGNPAFGGKIAANTQEARAPSQKTSFVESAPVAAGGGGGGAGGSAGAGGSGGAGAGGAAGGAKAAAGGASAPASGAAAATPAAAGGAPAAGAATGATGVATPATVVATDGK